MFRYDTMFEKKKIEIAFVANSTSKTRNSNLRGMGSRKTFYGKVGITKTRPAIISKYCWEYMVQFRAAESDCWA